MNWYKEEYKGNLIPFPEAFTISLNDENLKPEWIAKRVKYSEFHITRGKKNLVLAVGESWTYGETLPDIATGIERYSISSQIDNCFGPKIAMMKDSDYYQYAVPGNCNAYMVLELERILKHLSDNFQYDTIQVIFQLTDPGRELAIFRNLENSKFDEIYNPQADTTFEEWLIRYDDIFLTEIDRIQKQYANVNMLVWKNFCCFQNKNQYPGIAIVEESWIKFSARFLGINLEMQKFQSVGWYIDFENQYKDRLKFLKEFAEAEVNKIEISNNFIQANFLHSQHPNVIAHSLWAYKLFNEIPDV